MNSLYFLIVVMDITTSRLININDSFKSLIFLKEYLLTNFSDLIYFYSSKGLMDSLYFVIVVMDITTSRLININDSFKSLIFLKEYLLTKFSDLIYFFSFILGTD